MMNKVARKEAIYSMVQITCYQSTSTLRHFEKLFLWALDFSLSFTLCIKFLWGGGRLFGNRQGYHVVRVVLQDRQLVCLKAEHGYKHIITSKGLSYNHCHNQAHPNIHISTILTCFFVHTGKKYFSSSLFLPDVLITDPYILFTYTVWSPLRTTTLTFLSPLAGQYVRR